MPLVLVNIPQLRQMVCSMANTGEMNNKQLLQMVGVRSTVTYSNTQPELLPADVSRVAAQPNLKKFAVASCFVQNEKSPGGMFWVAMVFF